MTRFVAHVNPTRSVCDRLASVYPSNPFVTYEWSQAERKASGNAWLLAWEEGGNLTNGCIAFIYDGRFDRVLSIPSIPAADNSYWDNVKRFCVERRVTLIRLNTYSSFVDHVPALGREMRRSTRFEYALRIDGADADLTNRMSTNHRRLIKKATKAGLAFRIVTNDLGLDDHVRLTGSSFGRRRARGEEVPAEIARESLRPYLESGWCEMFQAVLDSEVFSSMTIARSNEGGYLHTSGTSASGMSIGASHFLMHQIANHFRAAGAKVLNLGGAEERESGLARYKEGFGAACIPLESAEFRFGNLPSRLRHGAIRLVGRIGISSR